MKEITLIAIDIAKNVFQLCGVDKNGKRVFERRVRRERLEATMREFPRCLVVMEASGGAHSWGRKFQALGYEVRLIPPQFVKPFVQSNKNDRNDAFAIAEAAVRPGRHWCEVKSVEQQELQHLHRVRERVIKQRTAVMNELRGMILEYDIAIAKGRGALRRFYEEFIQNREIFPPLARKLVEEQFEELTQIEVTLKRLEARVERVCKNHPVCQRLVTIPGVGPVIATAIVAAVPSHTHFRSARSFAAWLGLVPRHIGSGDKLKMLGISKRGDSYLRKQLVHGARSVLYLASRYQHKNALWCQRLIKERGWNKAAVALAHRNARVIWALLKYETEYRAQPLAA